MKNASSPLLPRPWICQGGGATLLVRSCSRGPRSGSGGRRSTQHAAAAAAAAAAAESIFKEHDIREMQHLAMQINSYTSGIHTCEPARHWLSFSLLFISVRSFSRRCDRPHESKFLSGSLEDEECILSGRLADDLDWPSCRLGTCLVLLKEYLYKTWILGLFLFNPKIRAVSQVRKRHLYALCILAGDVCRKIRDTGPLQAPKPPLAGGTLWP